MARKRVLIVGGGFGGIKAALDLCDHKEFEVCLLSNRNHFEYHPMLYHTATGGSREVSSLPLTDILGGRAVEILSGTAEKLNREKRTVTTEDGQVLDFDILILAIGGVTNYFGIKGLKEYSYGIKSLADAEEFKAHLHQQLIDDRQPDLSYIIVGGGPTGVELAGVLPSYIKRLMKQHGITNRKVHVDLVEAKDRLLPT